VHRKQQKNHARLVVGVCLRWPSREVSNSSVHKRSFLLHSPLSWRVRDLHGTCEMLGVGVLAGARFLLTRVVE
jgi:hypothetical protein